MEVNKLDIKIVNSEEGDWSFLYINDEIKDSGHNIRLDYLFQILNKYQSDNTAIYIQSVKSYCIGMDYAENNYNKFSDISEEAFIANQEYDMLK